MAGSSLMRSRFEEFVSLANESIAIQLVSNEDQLAEESQKLPKSSPKEFNPEFSHQLFGDNESIFGYRDLKVKLYYSSAKLNCFLGINFAEKVTKDETNGIEADDVLNTIAKKLEINFCQSMDEFRSLLSKESQFKPYGQLMDSFSIDHKTDEKVTKRHFEIYSADILVPGFDAYHQRMQTFLWWLIDAASYIDVDDERWQYFILYEKTSANSSSLTNGHSAADDNSIYCFAGYATVYRYYAYPQRIRPRISQFLILPPFQKCGLGTKLLDTIYGFYIKDSNVYDITVEDPSDNFTRVRDFVDSKNCKTLDSFSVEKLKLGWSEAMATEALTHLKINKRQARRVYEILRFRCTDRSDADQYKCYRLVVKQRLNAPNQKQILDYKKLEKLKKFPEQELAFIKQTTIPALEVRLDLLDKQYKELEEEYQHIVERLAES
ncbi:unnamed protein product [Medioppia subpectinata]|uniref:Histone acetyltransferase type B catalytic subunit n=1 Tax=Medioppia subpectinata TaxID=1979941 RepID=A0A7R9KDS5_9ACAR|nr:unnamed protein product [Medioppia subpectinata]CAG2101444.1 unnamed protein product [Medioppia subpectinata]